MPLVVVTAPTSQPITVAQAKEWSVIDYTDDDDILEALIERAVDYVQHWTRRRLVSQTLDWFIDTGFPAWFRIPVGPMTSVTSIKYLDTDGAEQTLASDQYVVDANHDPGRIVPAYNVTWPSTRDIINNVTVRYVCGYSEVPASFQHAILMVVDHLYEHRGAVTELRLADTPMGVRSLLAPYVETLP